MAAPAIGLRPRFTPPATARLDLGHPLAQGMVLCALPQGNTFWDALRGYRFTPLGSAVPGVGATALGRGAAYASTSTGSCWQAPSYAWLPTDTVTVSILLRKDDATNRSSAAFGTEFSVGTGRLGAHLPFSDGTVYWDFGGSTDSSAGGRTSVSSLTFGNTDIWTFTADSAGPMAIYQNGIVRASNTNHGMSRTNATTTSFNIANGQAGSISTNGNDIATTGFLMMWDRVLPPSQIAEHVATPYALLRS